MSNRKNLIAYVYENVRREGKTILSAAAASGLRSVNEQIKESKSNPERSLTFESMLGALKTGMLSASQQAMVSTLDRLDARVAGEGEGRS
ncbi:MAG: hypothetical protein J7559_22480 [Cohnella sp.]|nr:hypothetical protein [Cohnella sp.]